MKRLLSLTLHDIKFQFRHGFYLVYLIVSTIYILLLALMSDGLKETIGPIIILSDPSFLGFFFIGAILFYEREQRVTEALSVTPVSYSEYLLGKIFSLSLLSLLVSLMISLFTFGISINFPVLSIGVILTASLFTTIGIGFSLYFTKVTSYLIFGGFFLGPFALPIIYKLGFIQNWSWIAYIPSYSSLVLIDGAVTDFTSWGSILLNISYLIFANVGIFSLVHKVGRDHES